MLPPAPLLLLSIVALSILLMLLRPRGIPEAWWVSGGALLLVALQLLPLSIAIHAVRSGGDVYLFLLGMMLLAELARHHGLFDWLAARAIHAAHGSATRLFTLIYAVGTAVTILLSNDATAVVLTPAVLTAVRKVRATDPLPYLFACALVANAASFVLPLSNPANLVVFHAGLPPLPAWLAAFLLPSLLSIATTYAVLRWYFRHDLRVPLDPIRASVSLTGPAKLILAGVVALLAVLLIASALGRDLGLPTCLTAVTLAAAVAFTSRTNPLTYLRRVSWSVLPLVAALFVLVAAISSIGAFDRTAAALTWAGQLSPVAGASLVGATTAVANNVVNNLPLGLLVGSTLAHTHTHGLLAEVLLIAVDLGPNLSVTGSLATILWLTALHREGVEVSGFRFLRLGLIAMPLALAAALAGLLL